MSFALLVSHRGAERRDNFIVLAWEHASQVELELASFNVPDNRRRMRTQPCGQFLRPEFAVSYFWSVVDWQQIERGKRATANLSAASPYRRPKR